jgi:D-alanyl-D-alanine endopeptidase (penicillin-binding protein 7)
MERANEWRESETDRAKTRISRTLWQLGLILLALMSFSGAVQGEGTTTLASRTLTNPWQVLNPALLELRSDAALVTDETGAMVFAKQPQKEKSIASITKLMTAMVVLDAGLDMDAAVRIRDADRDLLKHSRSRLRSERAALSRRDLLLVMLMSSENRAAAALARTTLDGGTPAFTEAMNRKAEVLGMGRTRFADASGLSAANRSTAEDLIRLVRAAGDYPFIRQATTSAEAEVLPYLGSGPLGYRNTNPLVRNRSWQVELSKTGYTNEAGRCLVMQARVAGRRLYIVLLDSFGRLTPVGDSNRLRKWIETGIGVGAEG